MSKHSIVAIDFKGGVTSIFFINKIVMPTIEKEEQGIWIYGRSTDDIILDCLNKDIEDENGLSTFKVAKLGSKTYHKEVKGYRKLTTEEKVVLIEKVKDFDSLGSLNAQKIKNFFNKALFRSNVGKSYALDSTQKSSSN
ncbi:MAG: hypothetical protein NTX85_02665 [Candidatus Nomurabacteria bacterium]|nr:hypothetical protein [Candidatus Nomurabacteria bacterium]